MFPVADQIPRRKLRGCLVAQFSGSGDENRYEMLLYEPFAPLAPVRKVTEIMGNLR